MATPVSPEQIERENDESYASQKELLIILINKKLVDGHKKIPKTATYLFRSDVVDDVLDMYRENWDISEEVVEYDDTYYSFEKNGQHFYI